MTQPLGRPIFFWPPCGKKKTAAEGRIDAYPQGVGAPRMCGAMVAHGDRSAKRGKGQSPERSSAQARLQCCGYIVFRGGRDIR